MSLSLASAIHTLTLLRYEWLIRGRYHVACTWRDKDTYYNAAGYFLFATRIKYMSQMRGPARRNRAVDMPRIITFKLTRLLDTGQGDMSPAGRDVVAVKAI